MTLQFKFILDTLKNRYDSIRHVNFDEDISDISFTCGDRHILSNKIRALNDVIDIESCYVEYLSDLNNKFSVTLCYLTTYLSFELWHHLLCCVENVH